MLTRNILNMKLRNLFVQIFIPVAGLFVISACGSSKPISTPVLPSAPNRIDLYLGDEGIRNQFVNLDYGIRLNVKDNRDSENILTKFDANPAYRSGCPKTSGQMNEFVGESIRRYMRNLGFSLNADINTDYLMTVIIREYNVGFYTGIGWKGTVKLGVEVYDRDNKLVYPNVNATGSAVVKSAASNASAPSEALSKAFGYALKDIDWDRIAFFLKKSSSPKQEANKQVSGKGDTALESTVIRWYITSKPQGADVTWRVVSSTPEVKNTNSNFLGSTPYESTETFDIKGLTYNNAGNVQIEVSCEKDGYITQRKRFNLLQAIDQKEISAKFNLIKDE